MGSGSTLSAQPGSVGLTVAWRVPLGSGYSGIAVAGDTVVTMFSDGTQDVVAAFDRARGGQRWRSPVELIARRVAEQPGDETRGHHQGAVQPDVEPSQWYLARRAAEQPDDETRGR